ncbi:MAG: ABC transporter substrate-binding protein [Lachnospiraceae bacterium]
MRATLSSWLAESTPPKEWLTPGWFTTSVETLVTANPDVIIFNDYGVEGQVQENMDFITNNAALADVPAVKNQNYVVVPPGLCNARSERCCSLPGFCGSFLSGLLH